MRTTTTTQGRKGDGEGGELNWIAKVLTNDRVWSAIATLVVVVVHVLDGGWDDEP